MMFVSNDITTIETYQLPATNMEGLRFPLSQLMIMPGRSGRVLEISFLKSDGLADAEQFL